MKFQLTFKTPDVVDQIIRDESGEMEPNLQDYEFDKLQKFLDQWIRCSECVTLEFDTEANTCVVLSVK